MASVNKHHMLILLFASFHLYYYVRTRPAAVAEPDPPLSPPQNASRPLAKRLAPTPPQYKPVLLHPPHHTQSVSLSPSLSPRSIVAAFALAFSTRSTARDGQFGVGPELPHRQRRGGRRRRRRRGWEASRPRRRWVGRRVGLVVVVRYPAGRRRRRRRPRPRQPAQLLHAAVASELQVRRRKFISSLYFFLFFRSATRQ